MAVDTERYTLSFVKRGGERHFLQLADDDGLTLEEWTPAAAEAATFPQAEARAWQARLAAQGEFTERRAVEE